ncbi:MAG: outer membrane beta-barrel protein [Verrucomicrobiota bacterium]
MKAKIIALFLGLSPFTATLGGEPLPFVESPSSSFGIAPLNLDLIPSLGITYDTNLNRTAALETDAVKYYAGLGIVVSSADPGETLFEWAIRADVDFFEYDIDTDRDNVDFSLKASAALNGAKTTAQLSAYFLLNNGNTASLDNRIREERSADSSDYGLIFSATRDLPRGYLEASASVDYRDFEQSFSGAQGLSDYQSYSADLAYFLSPGFAPKMDFGFGLGVGYEEADVSSEQFILEPTARVKWRISAKTSAFASVGAEFRSIDDSGGVTEDDPVNLSFRGGLVWEPSPLTTFTTSVYRDGNSSVSLANQNYNAVGVGFDVSQSLPYSVSATAFFAYENAEYYSLTAVSTDREDDFFRGGVSLSKTLNVPVAPVTVSVFYNYNENDSSDPLSSYDQHLIGAKASATF